MAEIAGLALSAIPILMSALQQYRTLYKLCKRFRKCKSGTEELINCLHMQQVIFKNETWFLLTAVVGVGQATTMLEDLRSASWSDPAVASRLDTILGDSKQAMVVAAQTAHDKMKEFEEDIQKLDNGDPNARYGTKEWRKALRGQFKFTFSETKLAHLASSIRRATKDYRILRAQVQSVLSSTPDTDPNGRVSRDVERIQTTQKASNRVYEILAKACRLHNKHHARFSLSPNYSSSSMGTEIQFQIAYRHLSQTQVQDQRDVLWFVVESIINSTVSPIPLSIQPAASTYSQGSSSKRALSPMLRSLQPRRRACPKSKRVRIRSPSPRAPEPSIPSIEDTPTPSLLPEIGRTHDFCTQLRACFNRNHQVGTCIGWLENSAEWKHRVFHSSGPSKSTAHGRDDTYTLAGLLGSLASNGRGGRGLSVVQRLRLAKLLSTATLNFYATPWMPSSWTSHNILLYNIALNSKNIARELEVFVEVPVQPVGILDQQGTMHTITTFVEVPVQSTGTSSPPAAFDDLAPFVRNSTLFGLGVMLLEIAFEAPIQTMRIASDCRQGYPVATTDLYTAHRQSKEVATCLGVKYSEIVTKCLHCDFGQGSDLSNPGLQNAIHRDIISELGRLEAGFQELGIR